MENVGAPPFRLPESLDEAVDEAVEIPIALTQILDLPDGVNHGGVMLAAEAPADFRKRCVRQVLAQIHGDLPGHGDGLRAHSEESADADDVGLDLPGLVEQDVAYVADFLAIGAENVGAFEFRRQQLIGLLRRDEGRLLG